MNQTTITGPNTLAIAAVPRRCTTNSATRMTTDIGMTHDSKASWRHLEALDGAEHRDRRSDQTRRRRAAPCRTRRVAMMAPLRPRPAAARCGISSAVSARMPPSPWLSARITRARYLIEMMMISAQNTIDATPNAFARVDREVVVLERLTERVQRARADVAVDDAQGAERQRQQAPLMAGIGMLDDGHDAQAIRLRVSDGVLAGINTQRLVTACTRRPDACRKSPPVIPRRADPPGSSWQNTMTMLRRSRTTFAPAGTRPSGCKVAPRYWIGRATTTSTW